MASAWCATARAEGWEVRLAGDSSGPPLFIAIDKGEQQLLLFEQRSPLSLRERYRCTTGENEGDKYVEGDLRTPEGVYFTEVRLDSGLDFDLYGDLAYTLNFPNPVDRIMGKTGSGIWIHGRGHPIVPRETKGCIALENPDMGRLDPRLAPGLPVIIAQDVDWVEDTETHDETQHLVQRVQDWAEAWGDRSEKFFDFYDPQRFTLAEGSFDAFRAHKESIFRSAPWLQVAVNDVRVIEGPGYWVTYFGQYYRSPSLHSEGTKRLYWMADASGEPRIVAEEWIMGQQLGLEDMYVQDRSQELEQVVEAWRSAWESGDMETYLGFYDESANQDGRYGIAAIRAHKEQVWATGAAMHVGIENLEVHMNGGGMAVSFMQDYQAGEYEDRGVKTLIFVSRGENWRIVSETWRAM